MVYNPYVSRFVFRDADEALSAKLSALADYGSASPRCWNKSWMDCVAAEDCRSEKNLQEFVQFQKGGNEEEKQRRAFHESGGSAERF